MPHLLDDLAHQMIEMLLAKKVALLRRSFAMHLIDGFANGSADCMPQLPACRCLDHVARVAINAFGQQSDGQELDVGMIAMRFHGSTLHRV
ncbi:hypothetical protein Q2941_04760 [Bradyrhizobium sp. UFLA05-153]